MPECVMIVTGETSGELYGALLSRALRARLPDLKIIGIGGERMQAEGVELVSGIHGAFGLSEALSSLKALRQTLRNAVSALERSKPSVLILIDYPDFNLKLAAEARARGIPVLYYVSPQVWAWRKKRVHKIARLVDRMAVILPFEAPLYRETGLEVEFVGHPVADEIREMTGNKESLKSALGLDPKKPLLALLPGSRSHELERLLPVLIAVLPTFKKKFPEFQFSVPFAPNTNLGDYEKEIDALRAEGAVITKGESLRTLAASDLALIASGTASFQSALLGVPAVVIYKLSPLTFWLAKRIVKVRFISLANILSGREVMRELLQSDVNAETIVAELSKIIEDRSCRDAIIAEFRNVSALFAEKHASERVAEIVIGMAGRKPH